MEDKNIGVGPPGSKGLRGLTGDPKIVNQHFNAVLV
jgi:hypothetical protein